MLANRRIILIISGGVAAFKSLELIRRLKENGASVTPVMTPAAEKFITPLSVSVLAKQKVFKDLFDLNSESEMGHIELSRSAELIIVAPASADIMAKMAVGLANDLASTLLLATDTPVLVAPAMNVRMWMHPATMRNVEVLKKDGVTLVGPMEGDMACGEYGFGRMAEPIEIVQAIEQKLNAQEQYKPLAGKRFLVTSGPTHEPIDPVRYIANRSSGTQGTAIANALISAGGEVVFITGPSEIRAPQGAKIVNILTADEMFTAVHKEMPCDVAIFAAAVADWRTSSPSESKLKKKNGRLPVLEFIENRDILASVSSMSEGRPQLVVGFAAETNDMMANAETKLATKGCDWIFANDVSPNTGIMGGTENEVIFLTSSGSEKWERMSKIDMASKFVKKIIETLAEG